MNKLNKSPIKIYQKFKNINFNINEKYEKILFNNEINKYDNKIKNLILLFSRLKKYNIPIKIYYIIILSLDSQELYNIIRYLLIRIYLYNYKSSYNLNQLKKNKEDRFNILIKLIKEFNSDDDKCFFILNSITNYFDNSSN